MRPGSINWNSKRSHVSLRLPPKQRMHRTVMRWLLLLVGVQWLGGFVALAVFAEPWNAQVRAALAGEWSALWAWPGLPRLALVTGTAALAVGGLGVAVFGLRMRRWSRGLAALYGALNTMGRAGDVKPVPIAGYAEVDFLLASYNDMAGRLSASQRGLMDLNANLQDQVTERTEQWRRASELAEQANQAKSAFLATMSHEIRTPLTGVIGALEALRQTPMDPTQQRLNHAGWTSANALLNLINDILDLSAIEAGKIQIGERPLSLHAVIDEVFAIVGPVASARGLSLNAEVAPGVAPGYLGDPARLRQVILNLVNNAIKFTDIGGITVAAEVENAQPHQLRVTVRDTGIGISEEGVQSLFGRFARTDNDTSVARGGTGLGLSICKQLVQRMGGTIGVSSTPGQGSSFWFRVDLATCDPPATQPPAVYAPQPVADAAVEEPRAEVNDGPAAPRVLLAEDNPVNQYIIRQLLESLGARVEAVGDGRAAVEALSAGVYDLVLMDVNMPKLDGLGATREARAMEVADPSSPRRLIVALTANVLGDELAACREAGMDKHLAKPVDVREMKALLDSVARAKRAPAQPAFTPANASPTDPHAVGAPPAMAGHDTSTASAAPAAVPPIDLAALEQSCMGSPERVEQLLGLIRSQFRSFTDQLGAWGQDTTDEQVAHLAHSIAGCALQSQANGLAQAARALEHAPAAGRDEHVGAIQQQLAACLAFLDQDGR